MKLKDLLQIAKTELQDLSTLESPDFRLEQAEYQEEEKKWEIIVSFLVENKNKKMSAIAALTSEFQFVRLYKKVKISESGEVVGLYMYKD